MNVLQRAIMKRLYETKYDAWSPLDRMECRQEAKKIVEAKQKLIN